MSKEEDEERGKDETGSFEEEINAEGHWRCRKCSNWNFNIRQFCNMRKCQVPRGSIRSIADLSRPEDFIQTGKRQPGGGGHDGGNGGYGGGSGGGGGGRSQNNQSNGVATEGEWICKMCSNVNYKHRTHCNKRNCGQPRDEWLCLVCSNLNYAHRTHCNMKKCGARRPGMADPSNALMSSPLDFMPATHNRLLDAPHHGGDGDFNKSRNWDGGRDSQSKPFYSKKSGNHSSGDNPRGVSPMPFPLAVNYGFPQGGNSLIDDASFGFQHGNPQQVMGYPDAQIAFANRQHFLLQQKLASYGLKPLDNRPMSPPPFANQGAFDAESVLYAQAIRNMPSNQGNFSFPINMGGGSISPDISSLYQQLQIGGVSPSGQPLHEQFSNQSMWRGVGGPPSLPFQQQQQPPAQYPRNFSGNQGMGRHQGSAPGSSAPGNRGSAAAAPFHISADDGVECEQPAPRASAAPRVAQPGEWVCQKCSNLNYSDRVKCNMRSCGAVRPPKPPAQLELADSAQSPNDSADQDSVQSNDADTTQSPPPHDEEEGSVFRI